MTETMQTPLEQQLEAVDAEIGELEDRLREAKAQIHRSKQKLQELEARRTTLAPSAFSGEEKAKQRLDAVESEHDAVARSARLAGSAAPEFEKMLVEAKKRRAQIEEDIYREEYRETIAKSEALNDERDELASRLAELLDQQDRLEHESQQVLRKYDQAAANQAATHRVRAGSPGRRFLEDRFRQWLS